MLAIPHRFPQWLPHWIKEVARQKPRRIQSLRPNVEMLESRHLPSSWSTGNLMASTASPATSTEGNYAQVDSTHDASSQPSSTQGKCTGSQSTQSSSSTSTNSTLSSSTQSDCMPSNSALSTSTQGSSTSSSYRSMDGAGNNLANPSWGKPARTCSASLPTLTRTASACLLCPRTKAPARSATSLTTRQTRTTPARI